jgi:hypothetical protein
MTSTSTPRLDRAYPGVIAGVQLEGLETGEWFLPPAGPGSDNHDDVPGLFVGDYSAKVKFTGLIHNFPDS